MIANSLPKATAADVIVIGGGPAGTTTALLLAREGAKVLLLLQSNSPPERSETLAPSGIELLRRLGLWNTSSTSFGKSVEGIVSYWGSPEPRVKDFFCLAHDSGCIVDRSHFDSAFLELCKCSGVQVQIAGILGLTRSTAAWDLQISGPNGRQHLITPHIVDASGRSFAAPLRTLAKPIVIDRMIGVSATFRPAAQLGYILIEAVDDGWFYAGDLIPSGESSVIYFTDADIYAHHAANPRLYLQTQLRKASNLDARLCCKWPTTHSVFSAATIARESVHGEGWTAVGDAAHAFDPLSSLGIYKAIDSAYRASLAILRLNQSGESYLEYERWSKHIFLQYMKHRAIYYSSEMRWPKSVFWSRRQNHVLNGGVQEEDLS